MNKTKSGESSSITSQQIEGGKVETVTDFIFLDSKINVEGGCSHENKIHTPWKESYDKPRQCIKKQRHHFANKGPYSQNYGFSVVTYRYESWTIKKAESWRIDAFKLWCWRRLLSVPWTARRSNQSILKEISPEYSLEGHCWSWNSNTLPPDVKTQQIGKVPDAGKDWGEEEKGTTEGEMVGWHHRLNGREFEQTAGDNEGQGSLTCYSPWVSKGWTQLSNWTPPPPPPRHL